MVAFVADADDVYVKIIDEVFAEKTDDIFVEDAFIQNKELISLKIPFMLPSSMNHRFFNLSHSISIHFD